MIGDKELMFSDAQAITASAASSNVIDLGPLTGGPNSNVNTIRDIGVGTPLWLVLTVTQTFADTGSDSTVTPKLQTDTDENFGSPVDLRTYDTFAALTPAGTQRVYSLEPANYERFIRLFYTVANGDLSAGRITAEIVRDAERLRAYARGFKESVD